MLIIVPCTIIFCIWFWYKRSKAARAAKQKTAEFWAKEEAANHTRKKDISSLSYLHVSPEQIPDVDESNALLLECRSQVLALLENTMVDLSDYTNTDLKLTYGIGNFTTLSEYDNNYTNLLTALSTFARHLLAENEYEKAKDVYLLSLTIGSKKLDDFRGLAKVYLATDQPEQVTTLISSVRENPSLPRKETILRTLREELATYA